MNSKSIGLLACVAIISTSTFFSCTKDDDFPFGDDLSINSQVPMTRSGYDIITNPDDESWRKITLNEERENECSLYALTKMGVNNHITSPTRPADGLYDDMKGYARTIQMSNGDYYQGGPMEASVMLEVGRHFNLINQDMSFVENPVQESFFSEHKSQKMIVHYMKEDSNSGNMKDHYAYCDGVNLKKGRVSIVDSDGPSKVYFGDIQHVYYYENENQ